MVRNGEMKIVTICGSMKFAKEMPKIAGELETKNGYCVRFLL